MIYTIQNESLEVQIDDFGAELVSIRFHGKEKLWQNENGSWAGHAPVMFPACGSCDVVVDGKIYPHYLHGFSRKNTFVLAKKSADELTLTLTSSEETKKNYPFDFEFSLTYGLEGNMLRITHTVKNTGKDALYFAVGSHESYVLDRPLQYYRLAFEKKEKFDSLIHNEKGRLTGERYALGHSDVLVLPVSFLENGNTAIFGGIQSNAVTLEGVNGEKVATIDLRGFSNLLLWHSEGSQMICIEPWQNLPDKEGEEYVEFFQKTGLNRLEAGKTYALSRIVQYH